MDPHASIRSTVIWRKFLSWYPVAPFFHTIWLQHSLQNEGYPCAQNFQTHGWMLTSIEGHLPQRRPLPLECISVQEPENITLSLVSNCNNHCLSGLRQSTWIQACPLPQQLSNSACPGQYSCMLVIFSFLWSSIKLADDLPWRPCNRIITLNSSAYRGSLSLFKHYIDHCF